MTMTPPLLTTSFQYIIPCSLLYVNAEQGMTMDYKNMLYYSLSSPDGFSESRGKLTGSGNCQRFRFL